MSQEDVLRFKEQESRFKGVQIKVASIRSYPHKNFASHILGYIQAINDYEYKNLAKKGYKIQDVIGRSGLEATFEELLRGKWGGEMLEVDSVGNIQRSLGFKSPEAGNDLRLTIDFE